MKPYNNEDPIRLVLADVDGTLVTRGKPNTHVTSRKVSGCREGVRQVSISQKRRKANQRPHLGRQWLIVTAKLA